MSSSHEIFRSIMAHPDSTDGLMLDQRNTSAFEKKGQCMLIHIPIENALAVLDVLLTVIPGLEEEQRLIAQQTGATQISLTVRKIKDCEKDTIRARAQNTIEGFSSFCYVQY